jgi:RNA polymerase-interacting CarD/CdnL/TRCF family regulator
MFKVGNKINYPGHGLGIISEEKTMSIFGANHDFWVLKLENELTVLVPKKDIKKLNIRRVK